MLHSTQHSHSNMDIVGLRKQQQTKQGCPKMVKVNIDPFVPNNRRPVSYYHLCGQEGDRLEPNTMYSVHKCTFQCTCILALKTGKNRSTC